jgi:hypothetical protein
MYRVNLLAWFAQDTSRRQVPFNLCSAALDKRVLILVLVPTTAGAVRNTNENQQLASPSALCYRTLTRMRARADLSWSRELVY